MRCCVVMIITLFEKMLVDDSAKRRKTIKPTWIWAFNWMAWVPRTGTVNWTAKMKTQQHFCYKNNHRQNPIIQQRRYDFSNDATCFLHKFVLPVNVLPAPSPLFWRKEQLKTSLRISGWKFNPNIWILNLFRARGLIQMHGYK